MAALEPERAGAREHGGRAGAAVVVRRQQLGAAAQVLLLVGGEEDPVFDKESVLVRSRELEARGRALSRPEMMGWMDGREEQQVTKSSNYLL